MIYYLELVFKFVCIMKLFAKSRPAPVSSEAILRQFSEELDTALKKAITGIINAPGQNQLQIDEEHDTVIALLANNPLYQTHTLTGSFFCSEIVESSQQMKPCNKESIRSHYTQLAEITIEQKKGDCASLAAVAWYLSQTLISNNHHYRKIEVSICQLANWRHSFVLIAYRGKETKFFYDPWHHYWLGKIHEGPLLISESSFETKMNGMLEAPTIADSKVIKRVPLLFRCNFRGYPIGGQAAEFNMNLNCDYFIVCSTGSFANPAKTISTAPRVDDASCCIM